MLLGFKDEPLNLFAEMERGWFIDEVRWHLSSNMKIGCDFNKRHSDGVGGSRGERRGRTAEM